MHTVCGHVFTPKETKQLKDGKKVKCPACSLKGNYDVMINENRCMKVPCGITHEMIEKSK